MKRVLCFVLTFVMMTSVLMTTVLAVDTERDIVVPETLTEEAQGDLAQPEYLFQISPGGAPPDLYDQRN